MGIWRGRDRVTVTNTVAPRDAVMVVSPEASELERDARVREMLRHIHHTLLAESLKDPGRRNAALVNFCLEARSILQPSAPGSEVLREVAPVGIRRVAPALPRRAS